MKRQKFDYEELEYFTKKMAAAMQPNTTIVLDGQIGAGKTTWTKHFFRALGYNGVVTSPTFTIVREYEGSEYHLVHVDAYRNTSKGYIDLETYLTPPYIACIEWSEYIENELPTEYLRLKIEYLSETEREYTLTSCDSRYQEDQLW